MSEPSWTEIRHCRGCGQPGLQAIFDFGEVPLADRLVDEAGPSEHEFRFPLTLLLCNQCSLVQIRENVSPNILFDESYPYYSSYSISWLKHCQDHAERLVRQLRLDRTSRVIEIASNDGYLLRNFLVHGINVLGIEPTPGPASAAKARGVESVQAFFTEKLAGELVREQGPVDLVLANNVLAHVPDPADLVRGIRTLLKPGGRAVLEVPYLRDLVDHCQFDTIYHEHHCYFSVLALRHLIEHCQMKLVDTERLPTHGGSLRLTIQHGGKESSRLEQLIAKETGLGLNRLDYYRLFVERIRSIQQELSQLVEQIKRDQRSIVAYGAAAKGSMLLNACGLTQNEIDYAVDRNPHKQGQRMPGSGIPIFDPVRLEDDRPDYMLLLPWNLKDEIVDQQRSFIEAGGTIIVPVPEIQLVGNHGPHPFR